MTTISLRSVRYTFVTLMTALTLFAVAESVVGGRAAKAAAAGEGLSTCGTMDQPCALEPVAVAVAATAPARPRLAEGLTACGTQAQPCRLETVEVAAEATTGRLASTERSMGMALRVKS
ncbi:MAG TPA: hypothetical protein VF142_01795 [Longimicrobium sp.]